MWTLFILIILSICASAAILTSNAPTITPRALLPRDSSILGYYSGGQDGSETVWNAFAIDTDKYYFTTSGDYYRFCEKGYRCNMYYSCSDGYLIYKSSSILNSSYCGVYFSTCTSDLLYSSYGDHNPTTNYWCGESGYTGATLYRTKPEVPAITSTLPQIVTSTVSPTQPPSSSSVADKINPKPKSKAWIAGAVAGPVIGLALVALLLWFWLVKRKKNKTFPEPTPAAIVLPPNSPPIAYQQQAIQPPQYHPPPMQQTQPPIQPIVTDTVPYGVAKRDNWAPPGLQQNPQSPGHEWLQQGGSHMSGQAMYPPSPSISPKPQLAQLSSAPAQVQYAELGGTSKD